MPRFFAKCFAEFSAPSVKKRRWCLSNFRWSFFIVVLCRIRYADSIEMRRNGSCGRVRTYGRSLTSRIPVLFLWGTLSWYFWRWFNGDRGSDVTGTGAINFSRAVNCFPSRSGIVPRFSLDEGGHLNRALRKRSSTCWLLIVHPRIGSPTVIQPTQPREGIKENKRKSDEYK